ncbi:MAG: FAD:protein FMN transferase [Chlamydiae bacterium]|nr:FAD:protein FMN transferase [Chlamydiota bacterium]
MRYLILLLLLLGCSSSTVTHFQGVAHTHSYHIQVAGELSTRAKQEIKLLIDDTFDEVDTLYNRWNPLSELSTTQGLACSPKLSAILALAMSFKELTGGLFDPTLGGEIAAWKESLKRGELPDIEAVRPEVDLDGMLKGYAIDLLIEKLKGAGYAQIYVEWGGDIRVSGQHPKQRAWRILVEGEVIDLDSALATSGNGEQQWRVNDTIFTHIVDPHTLRALEVKELTSVTVRAPTCALADALATACMTFSDGDEALRWAEKIKERHEGVDFWIVRKFLTTQK